MVFGSTIVGLAGMLAFVSDMPDRMDLHSCTHGAFALLIVIPISIALACLVSFDGAECVQPLALLSVAAHRVARLKTLTSLLPRFLFFFFAFKVPPPLFSLWGYIDMCTRK